MPFTTPPSRRWTYAQLWEDAGRLAAGLAAHGVTAGDAVVIALYNRAEFALLWLAALRMGAHPSPINFRFSSGEIADVLDDSRPSAFVYDAALGAVARDSLAHAAGRATLVAVVDSSGNDAGHPMLAGYKRPRAYRVVQLPMTATGKKIHYQMRDQARRDAADGRLEAP